MKTWKVAVVSPVHFYPFNAGWVTVKGAADAESARELAMLRYPDAKIYQAVEI